MTLYIRIGIVEELPVKECKKRVYSFTLSDSLMKEKIETDATGQSKPDFSYEYFSLKISDYNKSELKIHLLNHFTKTKKVTIAAVNLPIKGIPKNRYCKIKVPLIGVRISTSVFVPIEVHFDDLDEKPFHGKPGKIDDIILNEAIKVQSQIINQKRINGLKAKEKKDQEINLDINDYDLSDDFDTQKYKSNIVSQPIIPLSEVKEDLKISNYNSQKPIDNNKTQDNNINSLLPPINLPAPIFNQEQQLYNSNNIQQINVQEQIEYYRRYYESYYQQYYQNYYNNLYQQQIQQFQQQYYK